MNAIDKLRQARNVEELASEIEPLAQALAALADDTRQTLTELAQASTNQANEWSQQQERAAKVWQQAASSMKTAAEALEDKAATAKKAARGLTWRLLPIFLIVGIGSAAATIALWHWLPQFTEDARRHQGIGQQVETRWQALTPQERAELRRLMGWQE